MIGASPTTLAPQACPPHPAALVEQLTRTGLLHEHRWREALLAVPRHLFVPAYYTQLRRGGPWQRHTRGDTTDTDSWYEQIYADTALPLALSCLDVWGSRRVVSASPSPALTVRCLQALGIDEHSQVLEIGTGSGHTTGLLAHRLSDRQVTSIEIDPDLHHAAAHRLAALGMHPTLVLSDSTRGPELAEFDRVLVGHETDAIPPSWIRRTRPGGRLLVRISAGLRAGRHVLFDRHAHKPAELVGRFLPWTAPLPARRTAATPRAVRRPRRPATGLIRSSSTPVPSTALADSSPLALLAQLHLPPGTSSSVRSSGTATATYLHAPDGSWAEINHTINCHGRHDTRDAGPTRLLPALEHAHATYHDLRQPGWTDFGVTATTTATRVWHANPDTGPSWPLLPAPTETSP